MLQKKHSESAPDLADYAQLLYGQALILEGMLPEDPAAFSQLLCRLMQEKA